MRQTFPPGLIQDNCMDELQGGMINLYISMLLHYATVMVRIHRTATISPSHLNTVICPQPMSLALSGFCSICTYYMVLHE